MNEREQQRFGFIALIGPPNAGKSMLINRFVGDKVAIVTPKAQTTRSRVIGLCTSVASQLAFVDTPGIFEPKRRLQTAMVKAAWREIERADIVVVLLDAARDYDANARTIVAGIAEQAPMPMLALNKIDQVSRARLLPLAAEITADAKFSRTFMISALTGDGVADLKSALAENVPAGNWHFPENEITDTPVRLWAAEITREKAFLLLHQEIPYALMVNTEQWRELDDGSVRIEQIIHVTRESHKSIVVGKGGRQIKSIGTSAREELERRLGRRLHLFLRAKVTPNWPDDPEHYREIGLTYSR